MSFVYVHECAYVCIGAMNDIGNERLFSLLNERRGTQQHRPHSLRGFFLWRKQQLN